MKAFLICIFSFCFLQAEEISLKAPDLSRENIIGYNVGIRPYRKSGVRIEEEVFQDKVIIHNYGYGGSGLTLSWGGANEVLGLMKNRQGPVAVLGAGVIGLSTAYALLEQGYEVHVYADAWENLTSHVAVGVWTPLAPPEGATEEMKERLLRMLDVSEKRFAKREFADDKAFAFMRELFTPQDTVGEAVVVHFDNGVTKSGRKVKTIALDGKIYLEDLKRKVMEKSAVCIYHFSKKEELLELPEPIIVNCTSLGSRELFDDKDFEPRRGQLVYFQPQEGFNYWMAQSIPGNSRMSVSISSWEDRIILGTVSEPGKEEKVVVPEVIDMLIDNAKKALLSNNDL